MGSPTCRWRTLLATAGRDVWSPRSERRRNWVTSRSWTPAGLVVVGVSNIGAKIDQAMKQAKKVEAKELSADTAAIEADAAAASSGAGTSCGQSLKISR